jgi:hypothetical protein
MIQDVHLGSGSQVRFMIFYPFRDQKGNKGTALLKNAEAESYATLLWSR